MKVFEIKSCEELTWDDIPFVEAPVFAQYHIMDMLMDPRQLWMRIQRIQEFVTKEIGVYRPLENHNVVKDRINYLIGSGIYFNVSLAGKPFSAAFDWQSDESHPHKGFWKDKHNFYWMSPRIVQHHLDRIALEWHRKQTVEFTENLLQTPFAIAQEKSKEYFSVVRTKPDHPIEVVKKIKSASDMQVQITVKSATNEPVEEKLSTNDKLNKLISLSEGLKVGSKGEDVLVLQKELGFTDEDLDGNFGIKTNSALNNKIVGLREYDENMKLLNDPEVKAFLSVLSFKESGHRYDIVTGSKITFTDFSDHPRIRVGNSDAAGAYQFLSKTWDSIASRMELSDFSPQSQDLAAVSLLRRIGAITQLKAGNLDSAFFKAGSQWDAFPINDKGAGIGDKYTSKPKIRKLAPLKDLYKKELEALNVNG